MSEFFNSFVTNDTVKLEVSKGQYVEVLASISHDDLQKAIKGGDVGLLKFCIKSWNLTNAKGEPVDCTPENIERLNSKVVSPIANKCVSLYLPEKKTLTEYSEESQGDTQSA